ncbi:hypothetical protein ACFL35_18565 [Candidatus Riflebacteria bacterium]
MQKTSLHPKLRKYHSAGFKYFFPRLSLSARIFLLFSRILHRVLFFICFQLKNKPHLLFLLQPIIFIFATYLVFLLNGKPSKNPQKIAAEWLKIQKLLGYSPKFNDIDDHFVYVSFCEPCPGGLKIGDMKGACHGMKSLNRKIIQILGGQFHAPISQIHTRAVKCLFLIEAS